MDKSYYTIIKIIFIFFLISLTSNIIKNFMILSYFDEDIKNMVGISSYASLIIGISFSCIVLVIVSYICYIVIDIFQLNIALSEFSESFQIFIYFLAIGELIKLLLAFLILDNELSFLVVDETFLKQFEATKWFHYNSLVEKCIVPLSAVVFVFSFKNLGDTKRMRNVIVLSIIILTSVIISSIKWI